MKPDGLYRRNLPAWVACKENEHMSLQLFSGFADNNTIVKTNVRDIWHIVYAFGVGAGAAAPFQY